MLTRSLIETQRIGKNDGKSGKRLRFCSQNQSEVCTHPDMCLFIADAPDKFNGLSQINVMGRAKTTTDILRF